MNRRTRVNYGRPSGGLANGYNVLLGFAAGFAVELTLLWKLVMP